MRTVLDAADFRADVKDLPLKKRVRGFRQALPLRARRLASQVSKSRRENVPASATTASGLCEYLSPDPIGIYDDLNLYAYTGGSPTSAIDPTGLERKTYNLGQGWTAGVDSFATGGSASHEIHVYGPTRGEVGVFGPSGWINKHGFEGSPANVPGDVFNKINGINVDMMRKEGVLGPKGTENIKGGRYLRGALGIAGFGTYILDACKNAKKADETGEDFWELMIEDQFGVSIENSPGI